MLEWLSDFRDQFMLYGLALVFLLVGLTKFVNPQMWSGYEPQIIASLFSDTALFVIISGVMEVSIGILLVLRKKTVQVAALSTLWLAAITVQMANLNIWDVAIRDLGLTAYALTVMLNEIKRDTK